LGLRLLGLINLGKGIYLMVWRKGVDEGIGDVKNNIK